MQSEHEQDMGSMCNGVFQYVCEPEICDVPRMPYYQDLVIGKGIIIDDMNGERFWLKLKIHRELTDYFGHLLVQNSRGITMFESERMESYHAGTTEAMISVFHIEAFENFGSREFSVFARAQTEKMPGALYIYSAPLFDCEYKLGGIVQGQLIINEDTSVHDDH